ncbi:MAG: acyltransferase family protein [Lachnospiraceae bacterium]|nr:acyltransferase family protein [Lachnospiraceae bacterium]
MKKRIVSVELLRIISMMMVVMLHYLSKGELLKSLIGEVDINGYIAWGLESFCIVAVNVYMLISGYFLVESKFRPGRLVELICQVLFYAVGVTIVLILAGMLSPGALDIYQLIQYVFPIQMEHYWFASAYVGMYLFAPILAAGVKNMEKRQLQFTIGLLLLFYSVMKTIAPVQLTLDEKGYDAIWFMCVFLVAAYIRLYGIPVFDSVRKGMVFYVVFVVFIFGWSMVLRWICLSTGLIKGVVQGAYHYNHVLNLLAAMALFCGFIHWNIPQEGRAAKFICKIAPYTFGVYLLHEHIEIRWLWPVWCGADVAESPLMMVVRALVSVVLVFVVGILVDMLRGMIFGLVRKYWGKLFGKARK